MQLTVSTLQERKEVNILSSGDSCAEKKLVIVNVLPIWGPWRPEEYFRYPKGG